MYKIVSKKELCSNFALEVLKKISNSFVRQSDVHLPLYSGVYHSDNIKQETPLNMPDHDKPMQM